MDFKALLPVMEKGFTPVLFEAFVITQRTVEIIGLAPSLILLRNWKKGRLPLSRKKSVPR